MFSISHLTAQYRSGVFTPTVLANTIVDQLTVSERREVWISTVTKEVLLQRAAILEKRLAAEGIDAMPLYGIPFAVKDNIDVAGMTTTAACPEFAYTAEKNAVVVDLLLDAGAMLIGKTNLDQFATGLVGVRSPYGAVRNAHHPAYISGGSSSGSAVAVALGLVAFSLGTDTAGSGRVPAGFNRLVGLKPTKGLISTTGLVPACKTLDCISIFANDVADAWQVLRVAGHYDATDSYSREITQQPVQQKQSYCIAIPKQREFYGDKVAEAAFHKTCALLQEKANITIRYIDFSCFLETAALLYQGPWVAERMAAISSFFEDHAEDMHPVVRDIISQAKNFNAVDAFKAQYALKEYCRQAEIILQGVDVLLVPTTTRFPTIQEVLNDPVTVNSQLGYYTNFVNLMDMAAIAIPGLMREDGLPAGITLIGQSGTDQQLAAIAAAWQPLLGDKEDQQNAVIAHPLSVPSMNKMMKIVVVGAHLSGQPLNTQLIQCGARFIRATQTSDHYTLYALQNTKPLKPALVRVKEGGVPIAVEVWEMPEMYVGRFMAMVPAPLGIGSVQLNDGSWEKGFISESIAVTDADDISQFGGWKAYLSSLS